LIVLALSGCGSSLSRPKRVQVRADDYVAVPFPPRPALVEIVPASPARDAVWVDGTWVWAAGRFRWNAGAWVRPAPGARYARWVIVRRAEDGQYFFAPSSWRDEKGQQIPDPQPLLRAKTRTGAQAAEGDD
jgi:YXWGXW repeat-containing protein